MKVKLDKDGTFEVPTRLCKQLGVVSGGVLPVEIVNGEARLQAARQEGSWPSVNGESPSSSSQLLIEVSASGTATLPGEVMKQLGMKPGDTILMVLEEGDVLVYTFAQLRKHVREMAKKYPVPDGTLASEELIQERRAEANAENDG